MQLLKLTHEMRVESEAEAQQQIEKFKSESAGLVTYELKHKTKKSKGEIIEDWYVVKIIEAFNE